MTVKWDSSDKITDFFNIQKTSSIQPQLAENNTESELNAAFKKYIEEIRIWILAYRIKGMKDESTQKTAASQLKKLKITIYSHCEYIFQ